MARDEWGDTSKMRQRKCVLFFILILAFGLRSTHEICPPNGRSNSFSSHFVCVNHKPFRISFLGRRKLSWCQANVVVFSRMLCGDSRRDRDREQDYLVNSNWRTSNDHDCCALRSNATFDNIYVAIVHFEFIDYCYCCFYYYVCAIVSSCALRTSLFLPF